MQDASTVFQHNENISFTRELGEAVFFIQEKPEENNAQVLMCLDRHGKLQRISPEGISVRSRLHEYGAMPWCSDGEMIYYCRDDTQQIMRQHLGTGQLSALTPDAGARKLRYGDFIIDRFNHYLIAVREDHRCAGNVRNTLVAIDLHSGGEGDILFAASDFVVNPRLSPDGRTLAFISWNHPQMPWDHTQLWLADVSSWNRPRASQTPQSTHPLQPSQLSQLSQLRQLSQAQPGAIQQLQFSAEGDLYFLADWTDWWNLYRLDATTVATHTAEISAPGKPLCPVPHDCAGPPWVPGLQHYAVLNPHQAVIAIQRQAAWDIELCDFDTEKHSGSTGRHTLDLHRGTIDAVNLHANQVIVSGGPLHRPPCIEQRPLPTGQSTVLLQCRSDAWNNEQQVCLPEHISFPCQNRHETAHGLLYRPAGAAPGPAPLLVMVHGGPTGTARAAFNPLLQFWLQQGFAIFDVNHRGSSGYGRRYRQRLHGNWGIVDIEDIIAGTRYLVNQQIADADRLVIRGGSAGGYAVLAALANSGLFRGGTCCYGVSNLESLAAETHKFESHYIEQLIGPLPGAQAEYRARSPLYQLDRINAPVLWLHGALDKVVPASQATAIMETLQRRNPASRYICFEDEGHGFRQAANQQRALQEELSFYREILALQTL